MVGLELVLFPALSTESTEATYVRTSFILIQPSHKGNNDHYYSTFTDKETEVQDKGS